MQTAKLKTWLTTAALALTFMVGPVTPAQADEDDAYIGEGAKNAESCVAPTDVMRRDHMLQLLEQRIKTVHQGIRTKTYSLTNCISCHAKKYQTGDHTGEWIPPTSKEHFCQQCHVYTGIKIDCFECHAGHP
jgi:hypothetical protein